MCIIEKSGYECIFSLEKLCFSAEGTDLSFSGALPLPVRKFF